MQIPSNLIEVIKEINSAFIPPERITVTECAEKYRVLPASNREGGIYRAARTPFAIAIMDSFNDPDVEEISVMGSAQWAKTTILENILAYIILINPSNILLVFPTLDFARRFSKTRLEPMIDDSPQIKKKVSKKKSRDSDNTILSKAFYGGTLAMVGANSPGGLRGYTAPFILGDDIDAVEIGSTKEGDFMARAERAAETFEGMRKFFRASTPGMHGASRIYNFYLAGTMEQWQVPCPACNQFQLLEIDQLTWEYDKDAFGNKIIGSDKPKTARIACKHCGYLINESERQEIILKGSWIAQKPERIHHRSFFFNRFTSPFSSLRNICKEYIEAQIDPERMQTFTNLYLGLPYKPDTVEEISEFELINRLENYLDVTKPYTVPNQVLMLIASVDVQGDRLEAEVWGYGLNFEMWIINRFKFVGDPKIPKHLPKSPWKELDSLLCNPYFRIDGVPINILAAAIDSSFLSDEVYGFCRGYEFTRRWWPIKGSRNPFAEIIPAKFSVIEEKRSKYLRFGVNLEKQSLFSRLKMQLPKPYNNEPLPKFIHFDESICDPEYFEQLTAEHGVKKTYGNQEYILYEKKKSGLRNEALDLITYNSILAKMQAPNWEKLKANLDAKAELIKNEKRETKDEIKKIESSNPLKSNPNIQQKPSLQKKIIKQINKITSW